MIERDRTPFRYPLVPLRGNAEHSDLSEFLSGPDKIVRLAIDVGLTAFKDGRRGFKELEVQYGVPNSGMDIVVGSDTHGMPATFLVTDRIHGQNLADALQINPDHKLLAQAEGLTQYLANYYIDKGLSRGEYWYDLALRQFMYGHKKGGTDNIYLVDIDPIFRRYDPQAEVYRETADYLHAFEELGKFAGEIQEIHPGITFGNMGQKVRTHLNTLPQSFEFRHRIEDIKHHFD